MRESMQYDVVIVGAGPAGLAAAIQLKQACPKGQELSVCVIEKAAQIGAHQLSGAVLEVDSLKSLLPDHWQAAPLDTAVTQDQFYYLSARKAWRLPTPKPMKNDGNYIISLGLMCRFLAEQAEALGCEIYPGFAANTILYNDQGEVIGVSTGDMGVAKDGSKSAHYQEGMNLLGRQTLFAEGCHGQLSQNLIKRFQLRKDSDPQTYAIGLKEVWRVDEKYHQPGKVIHTVGWPLDHATYGGSFMYHWSENRVSIGYVIGLDYQNPWLNPFAELQRLKTHPFVRQMLNQAERISYGARALTEGGWQSLPKLSFPGGALIGCSAGMVNVPKIKGIHNAIRSGMLAADACISSLLAQDNTHDVVLELKGYGEAFKQSPIAKELKSVRNIRPGFRYGLWAGIANAAFETYLSRGHSPWTLQQHADHPRLQSADKAPKIHYPKPDGTLSFDLLSSVFLTNVYHEENQPCHLILRDPAKAIQVNYKKYAAPESRYCPAGVYEIIDEAQGPRLQINAQNCIHCKTCDIKDPTQNIVWQAPEGGGGPNYEAM
ncbi:MAG: electron transfer flavoprotein-ubiquinone oxidoreductase [Legionellaceae bacterium]|nr:electron transfer flavoprotein-ubiquinone oxidoreductase [Legionellaceae bacterium]